MLLVRLKNPRTPKEGFLFSQGSGCSFTHSLHKSLLTFDLIKSRQDLAEQGKIPRVRTSINLKLQLEKKKLWLVLILRL